MPNNRKSPQQLLGHTQAHIEKSPLPNRLTHQRVMGSLPTVWALDIEHRSASLAQALFFLSLGAISPAQVLSFSRDHKDGEHHCGSHPRCHRQLFLRVLTKSPFGFFPTGTRWTARPTRTTLHAPLGCSNAVTQGFSFPLSLPALSGLAGNPGNNQHSRKPQGLRLWGAGSGFWVWRQVAPAPGNSTLRDRSNLLIPSSNQRDLGGGPRAATAPVPHGGQGWDLLRASDQPGPWSLKQESTLQPSATASSEHRQAWGFGSPSSYVEP